ncbi:phosphate ABC transporter permease PstA [Aliivibrio sp. S4TY2]|uniref:phosphate ABC transporter permease PstA n=1 Tax=unclassified Aliivibrio TaxID=2645654 RepID=UPI00237837E6|nr:MULTISPECIES: phosphate ABC transporter permease PstA [unclassified Aliivibrio]MDD9154916.1 phosphate ABC transporter permease PstA [Aliivibrio sp. S4TY2]MDD9158721.1 phosphate ABC transporter permease PstA [Aliivibrio sp. S4TY1]MDD9162919.1 phosphate ABC transporter permease PstA [Aliivibrio sp. S4MY2]MDD9166720.1 phosphate ABC transporter permease PstA [Aliivibrio sp. S4MY4]MDD9183996.1 phosphate ABC transporter permease PstA [Aliivibrio sp. S4MY3]
MKHWIKSGSPWIWLTAGSVSISMIAVLGILLLIGWKGLSYFWPTALQEWHTTDGQVIIGQLYDVEKFHEKSTEHQKRLIIKVGNRDINGFDFININQDKIQSVTKPKDLVVVDRLQHGKYFGTIIKTSNGLELNRQQVESWVRSEKAKIDLLEQEQYKLYRQLDTLPSLALSSSERKQQENALNEQAKRISNQLSYSYLTLKDSQGNSYKLRSDNVVDIWFPNAMSLQEKIGHWFDELYDFVSDSPREANSEGGVFPAIFGTILLVLLMSIIVMPLGVIAAIYLHEYAKPNMLTRLVRIAVINLAGVPSIVYGVFGLGFFVYVVGGTLDQLFYSNKLPTPTFGTPGLLWSALTLAILTLPVVIVATEEGLSRIPNSVRHGSLALGATQFETLWKIVLPMASPAIMTGLILAVARAAGEVAPLMLVGVVKLAPSLPVDNVAPYLHLDRKFMHLGYHIYDVGFQSPNVEAARPIVYATAFLLVTVIIGLNLTAIAIRNNLREKYRTLEL